ncbi:uncharacterized protein CLUP02_12389 [Colletotrichum lupini]|uniref:Uncharacterized protein n=1 Tax=Colletotrichum lupini TaxID=145971 RepID=A0A9Q8WL78_9PEZI|nr:uncharacterized protein CLUP02_12389 [Colletotrichum lupini]UQC86887.1 hypothetical protein CLUP02_12389 [Colletotrichum lupini]
MRCIKRRLVYCEQTRRKVVVFRGHDAAGRGWQWPRVAWKRVAVSRHQVSKHKTLKFCPLCPTKFTPPNPNDENQRREEVCTTQTLDDFSIFQKPESAAATPLSPYRKTHS